jgi:hypothetical protein
MRRVGGYRDYLTLLLDAHAYDDILVMLAGESDAIRTERLLAKLNSPA